LINSSSRRGLTNHDDQGNPQSGHAEPLDRLFEEPEPLIEPPEPTLLPRPKSYSDFYHVVRAQLSKDAATKRRRQKNKERSLDALMIVKPEDQLQTRKSTSSRSIDAELLDASQQQYL